MQPMNRPPGPPYDQRPIGPIPTGIPPQMRPPQGFRPPQMQPGMTASAPFNPVPSGPPIHKMSNMNLGPEMPQALRSPNTNQMNVLSNGVQNIGGGMIPQNVTSFNDSNFSSTSRQENIVADFKRVSQSEFPNNSRINSSEQPMQSLSPAISHADSRPHLNSFLTDKAQSTFVTQSLQNTNVSQPSAPMSFQSSITSPQPSNVAMHTQSMGPVISPNMSAQGMQTHSGPVMSPQISGSDVTQLTGLDMAERQLPSMPQRSEPSLPQTQMTSVPQRSGPSLPQSVMAGIPQSSGTYEQILHNPSEPRIPPQHVMHPQPSLSTRPHVQKFSPQPTGQQLTPQTPGEQFSPQPPGQQLTPQPPGQQLTPQPPGQQLTPQPPGQQLTQQPPGQQLTPQLPGQQSSLQPLSQQFTPQSTGQQLRPQPPGQQLRPQPPGQQSTPRLPGQLFSPQPYADVIPPHLSGSVSSNMSPAINNQPRPPMMPPGTAAMTPSGFGLTSGANRSDPNQTYPPSSGFSSLPGHPGATATLGVSPRMSQLPGMQSRMPPPPGTMPSPVLPPSSSSMASPNMIPPNAGQQQYTAQQGGMQNRYPGASPQATGMSGYAQGQGRKLNPDDMPSPLQVTEEDMHQRSGEFITNVKGTLPPLVTTDFYVTDGGNASPRFIRSTMYSIPATPDLMKQAAVPFGLIISPMANLHPNEAPLYVGTSLTNGPVRCNRCKSYMSPLMMFMDGGRRFQCLLCKQTNEVPTEYYCNMDSQGSRADKFQRPELCLGAFEYIATSEYCRDKLLPKEPAYIFVLEMTQMMLQRGVISLICQNMKDILKNLPVDQIPGQENTKSKIRVGFITYDSSVHFYKLSGLSPEMCIVCDKDSFVPVPDGILCDPEDATHNIDKLMESIPQNFQSARETTGNLYSAINAGMAALKASGRPGKLFVFHSSLPHGEGVGKVKNREDRKVLGTDKEKSVLSPQNSHYNNLGQDLVTAGCGVDLYLFNEAYIDLATLGQVSRMTGGQCYKYTYFTLNKDGPRLLDDLKINVAKNIAFEAVMRVRSSTGVRPVDFYGHFFMSNTHDIELAVIDSSKAITVEIKHDDKITEEDGVYLQTALLYTSCGGQRRLRILNLSFNVCTLMADLFKSCDNDTLMNFFAKESMFKFLQSSAKQVKENLISRTSQILSCYRKNCASPSSVGQLILPELLKLLPLYINCLTKSDALSGGQDLTCDDRSWHMYQLCTMDVAASAAYLYPRLIPLSDIDPQETSVPSPLRTSYDKLRPDGVFLLENGLFMFIWVGSGTSTTWMNDVFGVTAPHHLDPVISELPDLENPVSKRVRGIIDSIRQERGVHLRLFVVPQQGKHELVLRNYLVEDKGTFGSPSYVEFLCHIHKEVRAILS